MAREKQPLVFRVKEVVKLALKRGGAAKCIYEPLHQMWRKYRVAAALKDIRIHGYEVLVRIHEVCERYGIPYYAECGTLLGFVRDGGFIKGDADLDFAVMPEYGSMAHLLRILVENEGYRYVYSYDYNGRMLEFTVMDPKVPLTIDFFQHEYAVDNSSVHIVRYIRWYRDRQYPTDCDNTVLEYRFAAVKGRKYIKVNNVETVIPENAEKVLDDEYGPWRKYDPNFKSDDIPHKEGAFYAHRLTEDEALSHQ